MGGGSRWEVAARGRWEVGEWEGGSGRWQVGVDRWEVEGGKEV